MGSRPEKCSHCEFCEYSQQCEDTWRAADSLEFTWPASGRRRGTPSRMPTSSRWSSWPRWTDPLHLVSAARHDRLRRQAELQVVSRADSGRAAGLPPIPPGETRYGATATRYLPEPDPGDVYFDLEGHPFWTASAGLFFLFGLWYQVGWRVGLRGPMGPRPRRPGCGRRPESWSSSTNDARSIPASTCTTTTTPSGRRWRR